jgi:hypothetical protein
MRLVRDGIVRPAKVPLSKALLSGPLPVPKDGTSAVSALLDERRHGR